jgi:superfamily II DNA or RNA helicase
MKRMSNKKSVILYKNGNLLLIKPTDDTIFKILKEILTFTTTTPLFGKAKFKAKRQGRPTIQTTTETLFDLVQDDDIMTMFGFWKLIRDALRNAGYSVSFLDVTKNKKLEVYKHSPENLATYVLRENQPEFLQKIISNRCGRLDCPPGFGKSFLIGMIALLFPRARIDVVSKSLPILRDTIYPALKTTIGEVGIKCSGMDVKNKRVMCYSSGCLRHAKADDCDILLVDESHQMGADKASAELSRWQNSRNFGLSASHDRRIDGKSLRCQGLFGPVIFSVDYQTAANAELVVPLEVHWTDVKMLSDPCGAHESVERKRNGYWTNTYRNQLIAEDANQYEEDRQVLITVETLEHALNLKKLLPDFTLMYAENGMDKQRRRRAIRQGFISEGEPEMTIHRRRQLTEQFEEGILKKVIATTVWNVGVSFNALEVLIRGDGGGSPINDIQIPGRVSRISEGKTVGVIHDYMDHFNSTTLSRSKRRSKVYKENKWTQIFPEDDTLNSSF